METIISRSEIAALTEDRLRESFAVPDEFRDNRLGIDPRRAYRPDRSSELEGLATFENRPVKIHVSPQAEDRPVFAWGDQRIPLEAERTRKGLHNIQLEDIKILEHPLAMCLALNLQLDFALDPESSFPTFSNCNGAFLDAMQNNGVRLAPGKELRRFTVRRPVALRFPDPEPARGAARTGYVVLAPDEGDGELILDHMIAYPGQAVGKQRIRAALTPDFFTFLCEARTPSFRRAPAGEQAFELARNGGVPDFPFTDENVLFCDETRIFNPRSRFDYGGRNYEFLLHELIDVCAWLKFAEAQYGGKFVGRMTTLFFDHHMQIDAARLLCDPARLEAAGSAIEFE